MTPEFKVPCLLGRNPPSFFIHLCPDRFSDSTRVKFDELDRQDPIAPPKFSKKCTQCQRTMG